MNGYYVLSEISLIISICFGIISLIGFIMFGRFLKKKENKLVEEIEPQMGTTIWIRKKLSLIVQRDEAPMDFPVEGIDFTGIGYVNGMLHIQTSVVDNLTKDNHGYFF